MFSVDKKDEITFVDFEAFGDLSRRPDHYGVEVAYLQEDSRLPGPPHFGHDQSWETVMWFTNSRADGPLQLETNVENTTNRNSNAVRFANWTSNQGYATDAELSREWRSMVVWRNMPGMKKCNVEHFGQANIGEFMLDTHMVALLDPTNPLSRFDLIQVTFFRNLLTGGTTTVRNGMTIDSAQVGIKYLKVGITKRSDFNLDMRIDQDDATILNRYFGRSDTANIRRGDATNDGKMDVNDAIPLLGFWTDPQPYDSVKVTAQYNPATGEIILNNAKNLSYIKVISYTRGLTGAAPNLNGLTVQRSLDSDSAIAFYTTGAEFTGTFNLGAVAATGLDPNSLKLLVNWKHSGLGDGMLLDFNTLGLVTSSAKVVSAPKDHLLLDGNRFEWPQSKNPVRVDVISADGKLLWTRKLMPGENPQWGAERLPGAVKVLRVSDAQTQKTLFTRKYIGLGQ